MHSFGSYVLPLKKVMLFVLFAGLFLRAAVPAGYMVEASPETGALSIRICGEGLNARYASFNPETAEWVSLEQASEQGTQPAHDETEDFSNQGTCPFALAMSMGTPEDTPDVVMAAFGLPMLGGEVYVSQTRERVISAPLPARGPPAHI